MKILRKLLLLAFLPLATLHAQVIIPASPATISITTTTPPVRYLDPLFTAYSITSGEYVKGLHFNLYQPIGDTETKRPVIIVFPAGGGSITDVRQWCEDFCALGYVTVAAEYKNTVGNFNFTEQTQAIIDSWNLVNYLRDHAKEFGVKKKKIFEIGISAGALTALQSGICLNDKNDPIFKGALAGKNKIVILGTASKSGACSPDFMKFINAGDPANDFYNGTLDKTIPYSQAVATYEKQISIGIASNLMSFNLDHKLEGQYPIIFADMKARFYKLLNIKPQPIF